MRSRALALVLGGLLALACGGSGGEQAPADAALSSEAGAGGASDARHPVHVSGAPGVAGAPSEGGAAGSSESAAGAAPEVAGAPAVPPAKCTDTYKLACPDVAGCVDPGKRSCLPSGEWSECACQDQCKPGEAKECTEGLQLCGDDAQWGECYAPPPGDWPAHALCHFPASNPTHISPPAEGAATSPSYPVCILSCFFAGDVYREDKMQSVVAPLASDHCVKQPSDGCWRCP
jgi:hypothetical protein